MMTVQHIIWSALIDNAENRISLSDTQRKHVADCSQCAQMQEEAECLLTTLATLGTTDAPPESLITATQQKLAAAITGQGQSILGVLSSLAARIDLITAELIGDSLIPSPALRGTDTARPRSLQYDTPDYAIALSIDSYSESGRCDIRGQVIPKIADHLPGGSLAIIETGAKQIESPLSEYGEFSLKNITTDFQKFSILCGETFIRLPIQFA